MLCNNRVSLDIMIYCNLRLLYWLYPLYGFIGTYFLRYIHELISFIHFMMNSFSLVHVCLYLDNRLSLDMIGMFHITPYWCYPYVIPTFHVVIIHRLFFFVTRFTRWLQGGFMVMCWVANIFFLPYRERGEECYIRKKNLATCKNYSFHWCYYTQQPTNETQPF